MSSRSVRKKDGYWDWTDSSPLDVAVRHLSHSQVSRADSEGRHRHPPGVASQRVGVSHLFGRDQSAKNFEFRADPPQPPAGDSDVQLQTATRGDLPGFEVYREETRLMAGSGALRCR